MALAASPAHLTAWEAGPALAGRVSGPRGQPDGGEHLILSQQGTPPLPSGHRPSPPPGRRSFRAKALRSLWNPTR